ncbi:MAG: deoxyribose-phosphate aldolase, partial [Clostridia bacterium]|nr:deoxyribose-phosphate aldolase [Clostridia bacterium]
MSLTPHDIAKMLDHSTLQPYLTEDEIRHGAEIALKYDTASMCARPCDVPLMAQLLKGSDVRVCTVIGFPHGDHETAIKVAEARLALEEGCEELDMVINIGRLLHGDDDAVRSEIAQIAALAHEKGAIVKVIIETCYLTDEQKVRACRLSEEAGADFVKTSTGYGTKGCTIEDLKLMRASVSPSVRVKGSGGIRDLDTVLKARAVGVHILQLSGDISGPAGLKIGQSRVYGVYAGVGFRRRGKQYHRVRQRQPRLWQTQLQGRIHAGLHYGYGLGIGKADILTGRAEYPAARGDQVTRLQHPGQIVYSGVRVRSPYGFHHGRENV